MFNTAEHDFGTVARGTKAIYRFQIKNLYEEDVHIASVRSSCGCTTPLITKPDLKTFEVGEIVAEFNTKKFLGPKSAVVTVVLDKPFPAEVQLRINGFIRSDVVFAPGAVDFGTVGFGNGAEKRVTVTYAGRDNWSVVETKAPPGLETEIVELSRAQGQVVYELLVRLNKQAPSGYIQDQITLVTNDTRNPEIPLDVEGHVVSEIAVSPAALFLGVVQPGQQVAKTVMVRGRRPFKITGIKCDDASFDIDVAEAARPKVLHQLTVQFTAGGTKARSRSKSASRPTRARPPLLGFRPGDRRRPAGARAHARAHLGGAAEPGTHQGADRRSPPFELRRRVASVSSLR